MTTSNYVMNMAWVFLGVNWLIEGRLRQKVQTLRRSPLFLVYFTLIMLHVVWLISGGNIAYGLDDLRRKLPLLVIPLVLLSSPAPTTRERRQLLTLYAGTVLVVSCISIARLITQPNLEYRQLVPYISHIRFALNVCFVIVLLLVDMGRSLTQSTLSKFTPHQRAALIGKGVLVAWFIAFLLVLQSYTSIAVLTALLAVATLVRWKQWHQSAILRIAICTACAGVVILIGCIALFVHSYYTPIPLTQQPQPEFTAAGHPYTYAHDGLIESGNYINDYVCDEELRSQWGKRSSLGMDDLTGNGYPVRPTLIRYLNAMGTTKDSVGMQQLTERDVAAIERGIANPVYLRRFSLKRMVYVSLFEHESHKHQRAVKGFSMLQRFELWKAALHVFEQHPWVGVGSSNTVDLCHQELSRTQSELTNTSKHIHNQYLTLLISFGLLGCLILLVACLPLLRTWSRWTLLYTLHLTIVLVSCLSEDTLETLAGCCFVAVLSCLYAPTATPSISDHTTPTPQGKQPSCTTTTPCQTASE